MTALLIALAVLEAARRCRRAVRELRDDLWADRFITAIRDSAHDGEVLP